MTHYLELYITHTAVDLSVYAAQRVGVLLEEYQDDEGESLVRLQHIELEFDDSYWPDSVDGLLLLDTPCTTGASRCRDCKVDLNRMPFARIAADLAGTDQCPGCAWRATVQSFFRRHSYQMWVHEMDPAYRTRNKMYILMTELVEQLDKSLMDLIRVEATKLEEWDWARWSRVYMAAYLLAQQEVRTFVARQDVYLLREQIYDEVRAELERNMKNRR